MFSFFPSVYMRLRTCARALANIHCVSTCVHTIFQIHLWHVYSLPSPSPPPTRYRPLFRSRGPYCFQTVVYPHTRARNRILTVVNNAEKEREGKWKKNLKFQRPRGHWVNYDRNGRIWDGLKKNTAFLRSISTRAQHDQLFHNNLKSTIHKILYTLTKTIS